MLIDRKFVCCVSWLVSSVVDGILIIMLILIGLVWFCVCVNLLMCLCSCMSLFVLVIIGSRMCIVLNGFIVSRFCN